MTITKSEIESIDDLILPSPDVIFIGHGNEEVFKTYLPPVYPFDVVGGRREVKQVDFDDRVDILPVADQNIFSMSQRITLAQTQFQLATSPPQIHNLYNAY